MKYLSLILNLLVLAYKGMAFKLLWSWFITPTFGLVEISFWTALGIVFVINLLVMKAPHAALVHYQGINMDEDQVVAIELVKDVTKALAVTLLLVFGFLIHALT